MGERMQSPLETALWVDCNLWWLIKCSLVAWVNWSGHLKSRKVNFTKFHVQLPTWMIHMAIFTKFHVSDFCRITTFSWISCVRREFHEIHGQTFKSLHEIHVCLEFSWISMEIPMNFMKSNRKTWISWNSWISWRILFFWITFYIQDAQSWQHASRSWGFRIASMHIYDNGTNGFVAPTRHPDHLTCFQKL